MQRKGKYRLVIIAMLIAVLLNGCSSGSKEGLAQLDEKTQTKIKVMFYDENYFMQKYGNLFNSKISEY